MGDLAHLLLHFAPPLYYLGRGLARVVPSLHDVFYSQEKMFLAGDRVVARARSEKIGESNLFAKALAEDQGENPLTDTDIITDAGALLLAGSDPTAISLTFLIWCVLNRPELQRELEAEVAGIEGDVTDVVCEGLPILNAVIDESLRLYGAAPGSMPRSVPEGGATLGGYFIPDQAIVVTQNWSLQRNPDTWENPDRSAYPPLPPHATHHVLTIMFFLASIMPAGCRDPSSQSEPRCHSTPLDMALDNVSVFIWAGLRCALRRRCSSENVQGRGWPRQRHLQAWLWLTVSLPGRQRHGVARLRLGRR